MKTIINILKIVGTSIVIGIFILFVTKSNHFSCPALEIFSNESSFSLMIEAIKMLFLSIGIWLIGLILFLIVRKKKKINIYLYFTIITIITLSPLIYNAIKRSPERNRSLKEEICKKGNDDGMMLTFKQLNKKEYNFINSETNWLPSIPNETKSINIDYYRDDFLGDFDLNIELELEENEKIDLVNFPGWTSDKGKLYYQDYQD